VKSANTARGDSRSVRRSDEWVAAAGHLDEQLASLIETIWSCERQWTLESRIEAAIRLDRRP
jgi:hypothetical protein